MVKFNAILSRFGDQGEKTGWTYILLTKEIANDLKPGNRKSFRVKGKLDNYSIKQVALIPMGDGSFIMAVNATMRKAIGKRKGAMINVELEFDNKQYEISKDLLSCIEDDPDAKAFFFSLPPSHRNYFSKWVEAINSPEGKIRRMAEVVNAMSRKMGFAEMMRYKKILREKE